MQDFVSEQDSSHVKNEELEACAEIGSNRVNLFSFRMMQQLTTSCGDTRPYGMHRNPGILEFLSHWKHTP